jgi:hypothetical protein
LVGGEGGRKKQTLKVFNEISLIIAEEPQDKNQNKTQKRKPSKMEKSKLNGGPPASRWSASEAHTLIERKTAEPSAVPPSFKIILYWNHNPLSVSSFDWKMLQPAADCQSAWSAVHGASEARA